MSMLIEGRPAAAAAAESAAVAESRAPAGAAAAERSLALDAYRGLIMILLVSRGLGFGALKDHPFWKHFAHQVDHVPWEGLVLWDLIQPAFMFMVGVAMPFAFAKRAAEGAGLGASFAHALRRAATLIFLSQVFTATGSGPFQFGLINVLSQIALAYLVCFWIMRLAFWNQVAAAAGLLAAHWMLFAAYPGPGGAFSREGNIGQAIDQWLLGRNYSGYYVTINFVSSAVTTLFGVWAGLLMRSGRATSEKLRILLWWACGSLMGGMLLANFNPMVKRIWTASFTIYSAGLVLLGLAAMIWLIDMKGWRRAAYPLLVVGANSIFAYCVSQMCYGAISRAVGVFTGKFWWVGTLAPVAHAVACLGVIWAMCWWLYQRKAFVKV